MTLSPKALVKSIDENTSVPLKVAIPIVIAIVTGVWWLSSQFADLRTELRESIARIETKVDIAISARADR
jgi:hypothetical protein